ncbi:MAG: hypothetical protein R3D57_17260 [Hyphomicrobiaceae bacterium]
MGEPEAVIHPRSRRWRYGTRDALLMARLVRRAACICGTCICLSQKDRAQYRRLLAIGKRHGKSVRYRQAILATRQRAAASSRRKASGPSSDPS